MESASIKQKYKLHTHTMAESTIVHEWRRWRRCATATNGNDGSHQTNDLMYISTDTYFRSGWISVRSSVIEIG